MKKFIVPADTLRPILKKLSQAVNTKIVNPVLLNLYCKVESERVELTTSDLEITIRYHFEAETEGAPFEVLLPFDFVNKVAGLIHSDNICVMVTGSKACILGPNDVYELKSLDKVEDFPKLPPVPKNRYLKMDNTFIGWLKKSLDTVSSDELRPAMTHACLDIDLTEMTMVSTDGSSIFTYKLAQSSPQKDELLIGPKVIKAIADFPSVEISWTAKNIGFYTENATVVYRRHEEKFPNYKAVIPSFENNLQVDKHALVGALQRCALTSDSTVKTSLIFKTPGKILLQAVDADYERTIEVTIDGNYTGTTEEVDLNALRMLKLLGQINEESISMAIASASKGIVITAEEDKNYLGLIMPLARN